MWTTGSMRSSISFCTRAAWKCPGSSVMRRTLSWAHAIAGMKSIATSRGMVLSIGSDSDRDAVLFHDCFGVVGVALRAAELLGCLGVVLELLFLGVPVELSPELH